MPSPSVPDVTLDRRTVVAFLRRILAGAEALPRARLHKRQAAPAGIPLDVWFDDAAEAERLAPRLANIPGDVRGQEQAPRTQLYMLSAHSIGCDPLPWWDDLGDTNAFHATVTAAGLCAANPVHARSWQVLDPITGIGVQLARAADDLPAWFAGAPLRHHLHWLLRRRGGRMAHAATLGHDGKGILILGNGGAGKSGTTLAGLAAGLQTVGDDYIALDGSAPAVARPLFHLAKQDRAGLRRIPGLAERLAHLPDNWMNKVEFDPASVFPGCYADALQIHAILLPRIAHAPSPRFSPAAHGEAMRTLIPTNLNMFQGEPIDGLDYYGAMVRQVPAYTLDLSDAARDNGAALADFVSALG